MRKKIVIFAIFLLTLALVFFANKNLKNAENLNEENLTLYFCDLNSKKCKFENNISIDISKRPIVAMQDFSMYVTNLSQKESIKAKLYGVNMYMGEIELEFTKIQDNTHKADVVLSSCPLDVMLYRMDFFDEDDRIFYFHFEVKR